MEHSTPLPHRRGAYITSSSMLFERAAYYGVRSLLIIFMIGETIGYSTPEAIKVYGIFTGVLVASKIVGALIGDFLTGSKISMIIGVFTQALGAFSLSMNAPVFLYVGMGLIVLGGGLYSPNTLALFGKQYLDRKRLLDSGFMLLYLAINLGAGLGIYFLSITSEYFGFSLGFALAGVLYIISGVFAFYSNEAKDIPEEKQTSTVTKRTLNVLAAISIAAFFWFIYELSFIKTREVQASLSSIADNPITNEMWQQLNPLTTIIGGIILIFAWYKLNLAHYLKFAVGFILVALAFSIVYLISPSPSSIHIFFYGGSMLLLSIAELFIAPIVYSSIAQYVNRKYMATVMAFTFIPSFIFTSFIGIFGETFYQNPSAVLLACIIVTVLAAGTMIGLHYLLRDNSTLSV